VGEELERRLVAVVFTDMAGYTALMQTDEKRAIEKRDRYVDTLERRHEAGGGTNAVTGATGLEPATCGVTGQLEGRKVNDGARGTALFIRLFGRVPERFLWLSRTVPGVCCPFAARGGPLDTIGVTYEGRS
jgi:class 3 adenylate cyclase